MTFKGPLGFRRLTSIGPLTYSKELDSYEEIEEQVERSIAEHDMSRTDPTVDDVMITIVELSQAIYPDNEDRQDSFISCMASNWAHDWAEGFADATTGQFGTFEKIVFASKGCIGWAELGYGPGGPRQPPDRYLRTQYE